MKRGILLMGLLALAFTATAATAEIEKETPVEIIAEAPSMEAIINLTALEMQSEVAVAILDAEAVALNFEVQASLTAYVVQEGIKSGLVVGKFYCIGYNEQEGCIMEFCPNGYNGGCMITTDSSCNSPADCDRRNE